MPLPPSYRVHIVQSKIPASEFGRLQEIAEHIGSSITTSPEDADVILTTIRARRRLRRHLDVDRAIANGKVIVLPEWLSNSAEQGTALPLEPYHALRGSTLSSGFGMLEPNSDLSQPATPTRSLAGSSSPTSAGSSTFSSPKMQLASPSDVTTSIRNSSDNSRFATHRLSPLICPNQSLLLELGVIMKSRTLDGNARSALSYSRAISALKAYPKVIKNAKDVIALQGIGVKIANMVDEYVLTGQIQEARVIAASERFRALSDFTTIYTVGPFTARHYYDDLGLRDMEDLQAYVERLPEDEPSARNLSIALAFKNDFAQQIPRHEVEVIAEVVRQHLDAIVPGCVYTICGGYRRGKSMSNDVDIIISHSDPVKVVNLCSRLVDRLQQSGIISHTFYHSSFTSNHGAPRSRKFGSGQQTHFDSLDKALLAFRVPSDYEKTTISSAMAGTKVPIAMFDSASVHRRVDLIFAPPNAYWTAVVGWTGSTQFERDIRLWANQMGLHFDSGGICRLRDTKIIVAQSEQDVFDILSLEYVPPEWRNADL